MEAGALATRLCVAIALCLVSLNCVRTDNGLGFVSIDCGGNASYSDANDILWSPDGAITGIDGVVSSVSPPAYVNTSNQTPLSSIRFFPGNQSKYCYVFNQGIVQGRAYLVRASFWAGSKLPYPTKAENSVSFKLLIYADEWDTVSITFPQTSREIDKEIYVFALRENIEVCLSGHSAITDSDVPFISSLVLRPLSNSLQPISFSVNYQNSRPLMTVSRINYGARDPSDYLRYSGTQQVGYSDIYDRIWEADTDGTLVFTNQSIVSNVTTDEVPIPVMQTARSDAESINLQFQVTPQSWYFYCAYYAELDPHVIASGQRIFDSVVSNKTTQISETYDIFGASGQYSTFLAYQKSGIYVDTPALNFDMKKTTMSLNGPLINAFEVFMTFDKDLSLGTIDVEVLVVKNISNSFGNLSTWRGDPCLPYPYNWVVCSSEERPSITEIHLENQDLSGDIPSYFNSLGKLTVLSLASNKLTGTIPDLSSLLKLTFLDLHHNNLSGTIPSFLGKLPAIKEFVMHCRDLRNNNFSGAIPQELLAKVSTSELDLRKVMSRIKFMHKDDARLRY
ncbi:hypothetical protein KP509_33G024200 [Ceratopteris richardii]|uniref:Malectin-like domain-containing protein n=1 Tax=Ceratopteris richardii TaxID=49495 RepID=A0A8T2QPD3_CERRI|nr:hypothetical protein KP509_33G024200 [Ceratopteris richardii]